VLIQISILQVVDADFQIHYRSTITALYNFRNEKGRRGFGGFSWTPPRGRRLGAKSGCERSILHFAVYGTVSKDGSTGCRGQLPHTKDTYVKHNAMVLLGKRSEQKLRRKREFTKRPGVRQIEPGRSKSRCLGSPASANFQHPDTR
jgi:hypothetical protein